GILTFRKETLDTAQNSLGRIAVTLAQTFNDIHQLGQDLNSNLGGDFFVVPTPKVISAINNNVASTITASISSVSALTTSNYKFSFDGTNYTLTRLSDNSSVSSLIAPSGASPLVMDGVSVTSATINA
ncbi:MAG: flagellar hook-associated protein FlgK, partial [Pseudomonadota bacterium]